MKWYQISDENELRELCENVLKESQDLVKLYKSGKVKVFKALLGAVSSKSNHRADMAKCNVILKQLLENNKN